jgi:hypothetical protein
LDWTLARLTQYTKWRGREAYRAVRRRLSLDYARLAYWLPTRNPDFLGIGAPRSATTWLYQRLSLHPEICLSKRKEVHFLSIPEGKGTYVYGPDVSHFIRRPYDLNDPHHWRWYRSLFGKCGNKVSGEITPVYSVLDADRIAVVKEHLPDLKLIYIMRNPIARAWSGVRKELWWRFHMHPHEVSSPDALMRMAMRPFVLACGNYADAITRWETHYPDRILYLFYDDIMVDAQDVLRGVCDFLHVDRGPLETAGGHSERVNDVPTDDIPPAVRNALAAYYAPQLPLLEQKFGRSFSHWI